MQDEKQTKHVQLFVRTGSSGSPSSYLPIVCQLLHAGAGHEGIAGGCDKDGSLGNPRPVPVETVWVALQTRHSHCLLAFSADA